MIARAEPFLAELLSNPIENIAVISHGAIGGVMVSLLAGHDPETTLSHQPNDVVFRVTVSALRAGNVAHYVEERGPFERIAIAERPYVPR